MSESHCMRFVTCASETRFRASGGASSDGARGLIVMAAWGCGAVMMSLCGGGLRLASRGAAILVVASRFTLTRPSYGAARFASQTTRAAFRPTGQPRVPPDKLFRRRCSNRQPKGDSVMPRRELAPTTDKRVYSLGEKAQNPFPDR